MCEIKPWRRTVQRKKSSGHVCMVDDIWLSALCSTTKWSERKHKRNLQVTKHTNHADTQKWRSNIWATLRLCMQYAQFSSVRSPSVSVCVFLIRRGPIWLWMWWRCRWCCPWRSTTGRSVPQWRSAASTTSPGSSASGPWSPGSRRACWSPVSPHLSRPAASGGPTTCRAGA